MDGLPEVVLWDGKDLKALKKLAYRYLVFRTYNGLDIPSDSLRLLHQMIYEDKVLQSHNGHPPLKQFQYKDYDQLLAYVRQKHNRKIHQPYLRELKRRMAEQRWEQQQQIIRDQIVAHQELDLMCGAETAQLPEAAAAAAAAPWPVIDLTFDSDSEDEGNDGNASASEGLASAQHSHAGTVLAAAEAAEDGPGCSADACKGLDHLYLEEIQSPWRPEAAAEDGPGRSADARTGSDQSPCRSDATAAAAAGSGAAPCDASTTDPPPGLARPASADTAAAAALAAAREVTAADTCLLGKRQRGEADRSQQQQSDAEQQQQHCDEAEQQQQMPTKRQCLQDQQQQQQHGMETAANPPATAGMSATAAAAAAEASSPSLMETEDLANTGPVTYVPSFKSGSLTPTQDLNPIRSPARSGSPVGTVDLETMDMGQEVDGPAIAAANLATSPQDKAGSGSLTPSEVLRECFPEVLQECDQDHSRNRNSMAAMAAMKAELAAMAAELGCPLNPSDEVISEPPETAATAAAAGNNQDETAAAAAASMGHSAIQSPVIRWTMAEPAAAAATFIQKPTAAATSLHEPSAASAAAFVAAAAAATAAAAIAEPVGSCSRVHDESRTITTPALTTAAAEPPRHVLAWIRYYKPTGAADGTNPAVAAAAAACISRAFGPSAQQVLLQPPGVTVGISQQQQRQQQRSQQQQHIYSQNMVGQPPPPAAAAAAPGGGGQVQTQIQFGGNDKDLSDDEEEHHGRGTHGNTSVAVQTKANREKARREKINDSFTKLAKLIDPNDEPQTDKLSILREAIRYVQQAHAQISQAQTLQKVLQEKVVDLEQEKAQLQFQLFQLTGVPQGGLMAPRMIAPAQQPFQAE